MVINDESIKSLLSDYANRGNRQYNYFFGMVMASMGKMMLLGSLSSLANKYYIVGINEDEVVMIGLSMMAEPKGFTVIPKDKIKSLEVSKWLFGIGKKITVTMEDSSKIKFKANNFTAGIKKQKENLIAIEKLFCK